MSPYDDGYDDAYDDAYDAAYEDAYDDAYANASDDYADEVASQGAAGAVGAGSGAAAAGSKYGTRHWSRGWLGPVATFLTFCVVAYLGLSFLTVWWRANNDDQKKNADAIVVLGAAQYDGRPSRVFAARLDHALDLYKKGAAKTIYVTGGNQPGDRFTEATAGANYLIARGVPDSAIVRETTSKSSYESLAASARILKERGQRRVVLVTDPFHAARVVAIADELGLDAGTSPTRTSPITGFDEWKRMGSETLRVAVGRILGFRRISRDGTIGSLIGGDI